MDYLAKKQII